jgi:putative restriction endonuclease
VALKAEKAELLQRVAAALHLSGWQLLWLNQDHPAKARLIKGSQSLDAWIYIWNLTPGGRPKTRPLERRIQPTGIGDRFRASPGARTFILGWSAETNVFAAFDYRFHAGQIGNSPSIQTDLPALEAAAQDGLGVFAKTTGELSIGVRPDMFGLYVEQMQALHASGTSQAQLSLLRRMAEDALDVGFDEIDASVPPQRRKVMTATLRLLRDRRFSQKVLSAYRHRCAFCEIQLRLLDAAHILPVAHPDSDDLVTNGVALCALHHRAYDAALVRFDDTYSIEISTAAIAGLASAGLSGGAQQFAAALRPSLLLPKAKAEHPSAQMIGKANALRGWQ